MFENPARELVAQGVQHFLYAVQMGMIGEKSIITAWSANNEATLLSANLGSGADDCSGVIVNGTTLPSEKYRLKMHPAENVIITDVPL